MKAVWTMLLIGCLATGTAFTAEPSSGDEDALQRVVQEQKSLQTGLEGGDAGGLTARQISVIRKAQTEVFALAEGKTAFDQLTVDEQARLHNALERINAEVANTRMARDQQDVCRHETKTGSSIKTTRCATRAERDQTREGARGWMERPRVCVPPGCGQ